jgi:3D-(3,5/4)-trihydroxycyclohexane-1,2-dione acylhydrolase (decyclizing)
MGYEIAGGLGVKLADPSREVYALVGDGSYLMMAQEIVTALQEHVKINIVLLDDHGFSSIGGLSRAVEVEVLARNIDIGPPPFCAAAFMRRLGSARDIFWPSH